jgi:hypothetical protein
LGFPAGARPSENGGGMVPLANPRARPNPMV